MWTTQRRCPAEVDDAGRHAGVTAQLCATIRGVFLDHATEVEAHARHAQPQAWTVPVDAMPAADVHGLCDFVGAWHASALGIPPARGDARGGIEQARASRAQR